MTNFNKFWFLSHRKALSDNQSSVSFLFWIGTFLAFPSNPLSRLRMAEKNAFPYTGNKPAREQFVLLSVPLPPGLLSLSSATTTLVRSPLPLGPRVSGWEIVCVSPIKVACVSGRLPSLSGRQIPRWFSQPDVTWAPLPSSGARGWQPVLGLRPHSFQGEVLQLWYPSRISAATRGSRASPFLCPSCWFPCGFFCKTLAIRFLSR